MIWAITFGTKRMRWWRVAMGFAVIQTIFSITEDAFLVCQNR